MYVYLISTLPCLMVPFALRTMCWPASKNPPVLALAYPSHASPTSHPTSPLSASQSLNLLHLSPLCSLLGQPFLPLLQASESSPTPKDKALLAAPSLSPQRKSTPHSQDLPGPRTTTHGWPLAFMYWTNGWERSLQLFSVAWFDTNPSKCCRHPGRWHCRWRVTKLFFFPTKEWATFLIQCLVQWFHVGATNIFALKFQFEVIFYSEFLISANLRDLQTRQTLTESLNASAQPPLCIFPPLFGAAFLIQKVSRLTANLL